MDDFEPSKTHFYPRSPCGERRTKKLRMPVPAYFYPRSPCGERLYCHLLRTSYSKFLSTLSLRRATFRGDHGHISGDISIHALLAESDTRSALCRRPHDISIHALLAESDLAVADLGKGNVRISIHALLAESDPFLAFQTRSEPGFLSTLSLRRATPTPRCRQHSRGLFLSTLSLRRATLPGVDFRNAFMHFYPRSPCGERPAQKRYHGSPAADFYPRSPCGERRSASRYFSMPS